VQILHHLRHFGTQARVLVPAALHQFPQLIVKSRVSGSWRTLPPNYGPSHRYRRTLAERGRASEDLRWIVNRSVGACLLVAIGLSTTDLDHDHRKREHIRLSARRPFLQDLGRSPPRSAAGCYEGSTRGALPMSEAEIRYARMIRSVHYDIRLQTSMSETTRFGNDRTFTPLRSP